MFGLLVSYKYVDVNWEIKESSSTVGNSTRMCPALALSELVYRTFYGVNAIGLFTRLTSVEYFRRDSRIQKPPLLLFTIFLFCDFEFKLTLEIMIWIESFEHSMICIRFGH